MIWAEVEKFQLSDNSDKIGWKFAKNGNFTVNSVYECLTNEDSGYHYKHIWKGKIPAKIKFFMCLMKNEAILTKDNMLSRKWNGNPECYFCDRHESIDHLFFTCAVARAVWACVARCLRADDIPVNLSHCWAWLDKWLPQDSSIGRAGNIGRTGVVLPNPRTASDRSTY